MAAPRAALPAHVATPSGSACPAAWKAKSMIVVVPPAAAAAVPEG